MAEPDERPPDEREPHLVGDGDDAEPLLTAEDAAEVEAVAEVEPVAAALSRLRAPATRTRVEGTARMIDVDEPPV